MKAFHGIATGRTIGFPAETAPDWDDVHKIWQRRGRAVRPNLPTGKIAVIAKARTITRPRFTLGGAIPLTFLLQSDAREGPTEVAFPPDATAVENGRRFTER